MRLYHVTRQYRCPGIAADGFRDSVRAGIHGVWLSDELWLQGSTIPLQDAEILSPDEVVFAFEVPDDVADQYEAKNEPLPPDDEDYDPEVDVGDYPQCYREWCIPAEVVNRCFAGLVHWTGDRPMSEEELGLMHSRCRTA